MGLAVAALLAVGAKRVERDKGSLRLAGTLESRSVHVGSLLGGRVKTVHVVEGTRVAAGDPVVSLETDLIDLQIAEQDARVAAAQAGLDLLVEGPRSEDIAAARAEWRQAEADRKRFASLLAEGIVAKSRYDEAAMVATTRQEKLRELESGSRAAEIATGEATLERERQHLSWLQRQREEAIVRSPVAAEVQAIDLRPGDIVAPNAAVADLLEDGQIWLRIYVPEPELGRVAVGQRVEIRVDTWKDRTFAGHVASIRDRAEYTPRNVQTLEQRSDQVFGVRIDLDPAPELKPGMAAIATIATGSAGK